MDKTLSIIIPCYNVEKYIEECLESVCNDRDADIEVICVNDGSTDGTLDILEQWKQKMPGYCYKSGKQRCFSGKESGSAYCEGKIYLFSG